MSVDDVAAGGSLAPHDTERLAQAAYLSGRHDDSVDLLGRAHRGFLDLGDTEGAVRCAFWSGLWLLSSGEVARGTGWLVRAQRLLDETGAESPHHGYLLLPAGLQALDAGEPERALAAFAEAASIAGRFTDADLAALAGLGQGQALIRLGRVGEGLTRLDEVMVAVTSGEVSAIPMGIAYCAVIEACHDSFDLRRAREWTATLSRWCERQPDPLPYAGQCQVHRAQILRLGGAWPVALEAAGRARERLLHERRAAAGAALYEEGEVYRLLGRLDQAEACYRQASRWGHEPQPGLALLRLAQGRADVAGAALRRLLAQHTAATTRCRLLPAYVEALLAAGDVGAAQEASQELSQVAEKVAAPWLSALAAFARGALLLAEGSPATAVTELTTASRAWRELDVPYECARARELAGQAYQRLGDRDSADLELEAAAATFAELGAVLDCNRVRRHSLPRDDGAPGTALTPREVEVLRLVARGSSNRTVAAELFLSEKTVARHLSNIFTKLGVSTRSAATAYAYEHRLVQAARES